MRKLDSRKAFALVVCAALTVLAGAAHAQDIELRGTPQRFNDHVHYCMERLLAKPNRLVSINIRNPNELIDKFDVRLSEIADMTTACVGYAHIWAHVEAQSSKLPSKTDVTDLKNSVDQLTRALIDMKTSAEARDKAMAEKFQTNFINALACAFATDEKARTAACSAKAAP